MKLFQPLSPENVESIRHLVDEVLDESQALPGQKNEGLTDADYILGNMVKSLELQPGSVMVDSLDEPTAFFWGFRQQSLMSRETLFLVTQIFISKKDNEGLSQKATVLKDSIEYAAAFSGCKVICGAAWFDMTRSAASKFWLSNGYVEQETYFRKKLE